MNLVRFLAPALAAWLLLAPRSIHEPPGSWPATIALASEPRAHERLPEASDPPCLSCSVVLISIDTLRADHLGCYGYARETSPHIDAFASDAVRFARAYASSYVTADSHMSMFTSLQPSVHGVRNANGGTILPLAASTKTLGEVFASAGYATGAVTGGGNMAGAFGFERGMDSFEVIEDPAVAVDQALGFVRRHRRRPFFFFWHNYHVHDPYLPKQPVAAWLPEGYRGRIETRPRVLQDERTDESFAAWRRAYWSRVDETSAEDIAYLIGLYDAEIREVDAEVGRLVAGIRRLVPDAVIALVSDHGEQFGEHGGFLHNELFEELLRVPFVLSLPGDLAGRVVSTPVSLLDLAPTLLEVTGVPAPTQYQGRSLLDVMYGRREATPLFAEKAGRRQSLVLEGIKIIQSGKRVSAFDLYVDPEERAPLAAEDPRSRHVAAELLRVVADNERARERASAAPGRAAPVAQVASEQTLEQLRALGYVQ